MDILFDNLRALRDADFEVECVADDQDGRITLTVLIGVFAPVSEGEGDQNR